MLRVSIINRFLGSWLGVNDPQRPEEMEARLQVSTRNSGTTKTEDESVKLYRFNDDVLRQSAHTLLERHALTDEDIRLFCQSAASHRETADDVTVASCHMQKQDVSITNRYRKRRQEIHALLQLLPVGQARIDRTTGRLERVPEHETGEAHIPLPPLPPLAAGPENLELAGNGRRGDNDDRRPQPQPMHLGSDEERLLEGAAAEIDRALARYRAANNHDDELRLILVNPPLLDPRIAAVGRPQPNRQGQRQPRRDLPGNQPQQRQQALLRLDQRQRGVRNANERLRSFAYTFGAVLSALVYVGIQSVPLWNAVFKDEVEHSRTTSHSGSSLDETLIAVALVRHWALHARHCNGLLFERNSPSSERNRIDSDTPPRWWCPSTRIESERKHFRCTNLSECALGFDNRVYSLWHHASRTFCPTLTRPFDCGEGVLHIPSAATIHMGIANAKTLHDVTWWARQIDVAWFMPCQVPSNYHLFVSPEHWNRPDANLLPLTKCFRGVHDGRISRKQIREALALGADVVSFGFDHFDIHYDVNFLEKRVPTILSTLAELLRDRYSVHDSSMHSIVPVAFRVNAVAPMDGTDIPSLKSPSWSYNPLLALLNKTRYVQWMDSSARQNLWAQYSRHFRFSWPAVKISFGTAVVRDTCNLMADLQVDPAFTIHTTVFLSDGEGKDYTGGVALYEDYDGAAENDDYRRRHEKIPKGMSFDGSRGRILVSTGGLENRRCRLPTRSGVRATLQIWWHIPERVT